jgi:hypothetical protein
MNYFFSNMTNTVICMTLGDLRIRHTTTSLKIPQRYSRSRKSKDRQYNGQANKDKQRSTKHYKMLNEEEQQLTALFVLNHINISSFQKDILEHLERNLYLNCELILVLIVSLLYSNKYSKIRTSYLK